MSVHSEPGRGSCFEFEWTAKVAPTAPGSVASAPRLLEFPEPSLIGSLGRTITSVEEVERETSGELGTSLSCTPPQVSSTALLSPSTNIHGLTADELTLLQRLRVTHMGPLSATSRAWKRLGHFYGIRVTICPSVAEARAALQEQLANASTSATDARTNGADNGADNQCTSVHILTVDLDLGVTEQEVAAQLYTLAPAHACRCSHPQQKRESTIVVK